MAILQSTNVVGSLCVNGVAVGGAKDFKYCCFTASSTFTPSQDLVDGDGAISVLAVGGGGAAGSHAQRFCCACYNCKGSYCYCTQPGGGGGSFRGWEPITGSSACTITVGAGAEANGASFKTCDDPEDGEIDINSSNGGTTEFGCNVKVVGGGNGSVCIHRQAFGGPGSDSNSNNTACTRNAGSKYGGGAQAFQIGYCSRYAINPGQQVNCSGGAENQNTPVFDNINQATGSETWGIFSEGTLANLGTGNPNFFGMGGNAGIAGGIPADGRGPIFCMTGSGNNIDPCYATASFATPSRYYGSGGNSECFFLCNGGNAVSALGEVKGIPGNDGIVILTWSE